MNILFVSDYAPPHIGGLEKFVENITSGVATYGHNVTLLTSRYSNSLPKIERSGRLTIYRVPVLRRYLRVSFFFTLIPILLREIQKADIIHTHPYTQVIPVWFIGKLFRKKMVLTVHEVVGELWTKLDRSPHVLYWLFKIYERLILWLPFDAHVSVSRYTHNLLRVRTRHPDSTLFQIYNPLDTKVWNKRVHAKRKSKQLRQKFTLMDKWVLLFYGRAGVTKGINVLVNAIPYIINDMSHAHILFIISHQDPSEVSKIYTAIDALDVKDYTTLIDSVPFTELPDHVRMADCVVVPSITEGFGYTTAESCALGKPVVVSNAASLPEVAHGKVCFFRVGDSVDLARAVSDMKRGKFEKIPEKRFEYKNFITSYLHIYENLIEK